MYKYIELKHFDLNLNKHTVQTVFRLKSKGKDTFS